MTATTVGQYMTPNPVTIPADLSLTDAAERMYSNGIRHLPVTDQGHIVGVVSERDLALVSGIPGVDRDRVLVVEAMTEHPYIVNPDTALAEVVATMQTRKIGTTLVMEGGEIRGIFSVVDGLKLLLDHLQAP